MRESKSQADEAVSMIEGNFKMPKAKIAGGEVDFLEQMLESTAKQTRKQQLPTESIRAEELLNKYRTQ